LRQGTQAEFRPLFACTIQTVTSPGRCGLCVKIPKINILWFPEILILVHTLGLEPHPFLHRSFYVKGRSGSGAELPSHQCRSSDGGAGSSPSTQPAAALGEAAQADRCRSISLGLG
jgi:hypothetical protein